MVQASKQALVISLSTALQGCASPDAASVLVQRMASVASSAHSSWWIWVHLALFGCQMTMQAVYMHAAGLIYPTGLQH